MSVEILQQLVEELAKLKARVALLERQEGPITGPMALDDLTNVTLGALADNDLLAYDTASGQWIDQTAAEARLSAVGHTHSYLPLTGGTLTGSLTTKGDAYRANTVRTYGAANEFAGVRAGGSEAAPSAVVSGNTLAVLSGNGYGATGFGAAARAAVQLVAAENWTDAAHGTYVAIRTTLKGTTTTAEAARVYDDKSLDVILFVRCESVRMDGDSGGVASTNTITGVKDTPTTDPGWASCSTVNMNAPDGYIKGYVGTQAVVIPYWNT